VAALASLRRGARFELFFDEPGHVFQHAQLRGTQSSWLAIDDAKRADARAVSGMQRNPGIKADVRIAEDHRIFGEAIVPQRIVYDQRFVLKDSVRAEAHVARRLAEIETVMGLVPLPLPVNERDQRNRRTERGGGDARMAIKSLFGTRIKQAETVHGREALFFVRRQRCFAPTQHGTH